MKKYFLMILFTFICSISYAQSSANYDITTPFKLWLLKNEAKAMSELGQDNILLNDNSTPFVILPGITFVPKRAEEELWSIHRNIYTFLNEVQKIYELAKRFGNGKLAVTLKQARPEIWGYSALYIPYFSLPRSVINSTRSAFFSSLFIAIGLDLKRDKDLSGRLKTAIRQLKDEEYRLTKEYISTFKALYPSERTVVHLEQFLEQGVQKQFATGLTEIINSAKQMVPELKTSNKTVINTESSEEEDDLLSELESLSDTKAEEESKPVEKMESPDPDSANIYDIW
ncbi:MAG: hypothetical protein IKO19_12290 [Candidatus Riflebacteria bacterium]|nr:hypothetical protein [Candidatus Riflebacteria bacterium]